MATEATARRRRSVSPLIASPTTQSDGGFQSSPEFNRSLQVVFLMNDVFAEVVRGDYSVIPSGVTPTVFVNGFLTLVVRSGGVFVEWKPGTSSEPIRTSLTSLDEASQSEDWVVEGTPPSAASPIGNLMTLSYSADLTDLRGYKYSDPKQGTPWVRFNHKDGTESHTFHFRSGSYESFVNTLQQYVTLSRSSKVRNLVLFVDECTAALEKSVDLLNLNQDIVSRFRSQPVATSLTALSKMTSLITSILDPDLAAENQARALSDVVYKPKDKDSNVVTCEVQGFEHVFKVQLPERPVITHNDVPVTQEVWESFRDEEGRIANVHDLKSLIFRGGVDWELRTVVWKYLLGFYVWEKSDAENAQLRASLKDSYFRMKLQWMSISEEQEERFSAFRDKKALIEKDVARTDRSHPFFEQSQKTNMVKLKDVLMTYVMHNFDLGYVQGMSDYLSPILVLMEDEVDAFWCFVGIMNRVHANFELDQKTIMQQLTDLKSLLEIVNPNLVNYLESHESDHMYFCFRWMLVTFKREFSFDDIMHLWEVLWTDLPCRNFHLVFCAAILDDKANDIIENKYGLTEILKYVNNLSMRMHVKEYLRFAEAIYHQLAAVQDRLPKHICQLLGFSNFDDDEFLPAHA